MAMEDLEHERIFIKIEGLKADQQASFFMINLCLEDLKKDMASTLEQTKKTNGRVSVLEAENQTIRLLKSKKWLLIIISIGIFKVYELIDINWLVTKLLSLF